MGKKEEEKYRKLHPHTKMAIDAFRKVLKREKSLKNANEELSKWIAVMPHNDMNAYVEITEEMRKQYEERHP